MNWCKYSSVCRLLFLMHACHEKVWPSSYSDRPIASTKVRGQPLHTSLSILERSALWEFSVWKVLFLFSFFIFTSPQRTWSFIDLSLPPFTRSRCLLLLLLVLTVELRIYTGEVWWNLKVSWLSRRPSMLADFFWGSLIYSTLQQLNSFSNICLIQSVSFYFSFCFSFNL